MPAPLFLKEKQDKKGGYPATQGTAKRYYTKLDGARHPPGGRTWDLTDSASIIQTVTKVTVRY